jgi:lysozyme
MTRDAIHARLAEDEGVSLFPYTDTAGKITIGVGRNLTDRGISHDEAVYLLDHDIDETVADLSRFAWFGRLTSVRQLALLSLRFNLGATKFRGFRKMLACLDRDDYAGAASELRDSAWYGEVKTRGPRLVRMLGTGLAALLLCAVPCLAQPSPEDVVTAQRAHYGERVAPSEAPTLLQAIAADLTQTFGTRYGLLVKTSGNNCGGFACDIVCDAERRSVRRVHRRPGRDAALRRASGAAVDPERDARRADVRAGGRRAGSLDPPPMSV